MTATWHTPIADLGSHSAADLHALAAQLTDGPIPPPSDLARIAENHARIASALDHMAASLERIASALAEWEDDDERIAAGITPQSTPFLDAIRKPR